MAPDSLAKHFSSLIKDVTRSRALQDFNGEGVVKLGGEGKTSRNSCNGFLSADKDEDDLEKDGGRENA